MIYRSQSSVTAACGASNASVTSVGTVRQAPVIVLSFLLHQIHHKLYKLIHALQTVMIRVTYTSLCCHCVRRSEAPLHTLSKAGIINVPIKHSRCLMTCCLGNYVTTIALSVTVKTAKSWQLQTAECSLSTAKLSVDVRYHS